MAWHLVKHRDNFTFTLNYFLTNKKSGLEMTSETAIVRSCLKVAIYFKVKLGLKGNRLITAHSIVLLL